MTSSAAAPAAASGSGSGSASVIAAAATIPASYSYSETLFQQSRARFYQRVSALLATELTQVPELQQPPSVARACRRMKDLHQYMGTRMWSAMDRLKQQLADPARRGTVVDRHLVPYSDLEMLLAAEYLVAQCLMPRRETLISQIATEWTRAEESIAARAKTEKKEAEDAKDDEGDDEVEDEDEQDRREAREHEQGVKERLCTSLEEVADFLDQLRASYQFGPPQGPLSLQPETKAHLLESSKHTVMLRVLVGKIVSKVAMASAHKNQSTAFKIADLWTVARSDDTKSLVGQRRKQLEGEIEQAPAAKRARWHADFQTAMDQARAAAGPGQVASVSFTIGA